MKRIVNVISLVVMLSSNIMAPFTYAEFDEDAVFSQESSFESSQSGGDFFDQSENFSSNDNETNKGDDIDYSDGIYDLVESSEFQEDTQNDNISSGITEEGSEKFYEGEEENSQDSQVITEGQDILESENNQSEGETGDNEQAKTDSDISVLDYLFHEGAEQSASSPFPEDEEDNLEQSFTGDVEELTGEVEELTGDALLLAQAWETLNVEPITKSDRYNKVSVNVEAPAGTFPEGTYASIIPIVSTTKLDEIKEQISGEDATVSQESEIVAFDISFWYKLGDEEIEVQPKENTVKVTFNYEDNDELSKADETEAQEVKVFHIEEVTDEDGNKTGEKEVNDVTNKEESAEDGIAVADAESFSIYAVITTTGNPTTINITHNLNGGYWMEGSNPMDPRTIEYTCTNNSCTTTTHYRTPSKDGYMFMGWYVNQTNQTFANKRKGVADADMTVYAKWQEFGDLDVYIWGSDDPNDKHHYTLMDRNMGAVDIYNKSETTDTTNAESMGYYYQRGNNYGFDSQIERSEALPQSEMSNTQVDVNNFSWTSPYYSSIFVTGKVWMKKLNKNLWGDGTDTSDEAKQGPCPEGYHIPSKNEWQGVLDAWTPVNSRANKNFYYDFLMPAAGVRDRGYNNHHGEITSQGRWRYVSSSWNGTDTSNKAVIVLTQITIDDVPVVSTSHLSGDLSHERGANGLSVRCIKNNENTGVITSVDLDGGENAIISVAEGKISTLQSPTKSDVNTDYVFGGFYTTSNYQIGTKVVEGSSISAGTALYAKWKCPVGQTYDSNNNCVAGYTITFKSEDGSQVLGTTTVLQGNNAFYDDVAPTKEPDAQYTYSFAGWTTAANGGGTEDDLTDVTADRTVYASFTATTRTYTITWVDGDGNTIYTESVEYNDTPDYDDTTYGTPTKTETAQYTYAFAGWDPAVAEVTCTVAEDCNKTYTAQFTATTRTYTITWKNDDGTTIDTDTVEYGVVPTHADATKAATAEYTYSFAAWDPTPVAVTCTIAADCNKTYTATYTSSTRSYTITWKDGDGNTLKTDTVEYGQTPAYVGNTPTKTADAQYTYSFNNTWSPAITSVGGDATYTAQFDGTKNSYTITWKDGDGNTLKTDTVEYGQIPSYSGTTPTKTATAQHTFTFNNTWSPAVEAVTCIIAEDCNKTYTAQFDESIRSYTVRWKNYDGTVIETDTAFYGSDPQYDSQIPQKHADATHRYIFDGWIENEGDTPQFVDDLPAVSRDIDYVAHFDEYNGYIVYFDANGGEAVESMEHAGQGTRNITLPSTTKEGYTLDGWKVEGAGETLIPGSLYSVTQNVTLIAQWTPVSYTISYYDTDGTTALNIQGAPANYTIEQSFTIPNPTNKPGFLFVGWREYTQSQAGAQWVEERPGVVYYNVSGLTFLQGNKGNRKYVAQWTEKTYSVIWLNDNLKIIHISNVPQGTVAGSISDKPNNPTKDATAQYTYTFAGWTTDGETVLDLSQQNITQNTVYKAKYDGTLRQYAITFVDEDGSTVLQAATNYNYGTTPADIVQPATPTKADSADGHYRYKFAGWSPALGEVTADATYTATYDEIPNTFTVTWKNYDDSNLETDVDVEWGTAPTYNGETPEKDLDDGYQYTFSTWNDGTNSYTMTELQNYEVKSNVIFTAEFTPSPLQYSVNLDANGGEVSPSFVTVTHGSDYGHSDPALPTPTKAGWDFIGWYTDATAGTKIEANTPVTLSARNQTLYAHWELHDYNLSFVDDDESTPLLPSTTYTTEDTITLSVPTKGGYTFIGWKEYVDGSYTRAYLANDLPITLPVGNIGNRVYVAQWNLNGHVVVWLDDDGRVLDIDTNVPDETHVTDINPDEPIKAQDDQYTYQFDKWLKEIIGGTPTAVSDWENETVTDDVKYRASYASTLRYYDVTFKDEDGNIIQVDGSDSNSYGYNTSITKLPTADPTKAATAQYTYTFAGWKANGQGEPIPTSQLPAVTGDVDYVASFTSTVNKYDVTFVDEDGTTVLKAATSYDYNTPAALIEQPANPTKQETNSHTYTFAGWNPDLADVTENATYTATYTSVAKEYTVTLNPDGGVIEGAATTKTVTYGQPYGTLPTPTKVGYTFGGWFDVTDTQQEHEITAATIVNTNANGQTLKAKWTVQEFDIGYYEQDRTTAVTVPAPVMTTYTVNDPIVINNPTKEGHTFIGWKECVGQDCSTAYLKNGSSSITIPAGKTGDRDYLAIWNEYGYIVVWEDWDGRVLEIDTNVPYDTTPSYDGTEPTRESTDEYSYTFNGWSPSVVPTSGPEGSTITYTATYSATTRKYTITFVDGEHQTSVQKDYGTTAEVLLQSAPALSKAADTECKTYVGSWTPEVEDVTGTATYTANYTCTEKQKYTVRFLNYDGFVLLSYEEYYGEMPVVYDEEHLGTPQKDLNDGKVYKFTGWNPTRSIVTGDIDYIAQFSDDPNTFIVEFNPKGGTVVPYRQSVTFGSGYGVLPTPVKAGYTFDGWYSDDETFVSRVLPTDTYTLTANQILYAKWNIINYGITYQGVENSYAGPSTYTVENNNVTIPNPTKDGYTFVAWKEYVCNIAECSSSSDWTFVKDILKAEGGYTIPQGTTGDREYRAQWSTNKYTVTFENEGTLLKVQVLNYGDKPTYTESNPEKIDPNGQYTYTFDGWTVVGGDSTVYTTANLPNVSGPVTYNAHFNRTTNGYTVTFKNGDTILQSSTVDYGTVPAYAGETPTKASTDEYSYTFAGWTDGTNEYPKDDTLPTVTGETTYTAVFTESLVKYTVTFKDWDDNIIQVDNQDYKEYDYGTVAANISKPADPSRDGYTFVGWNTIPATMPAQNIVVRATYTINSYTISFVDPSGENQTVEVTREYNADTSDVTFPLNWEREGYTLSWGDQSIPATMPATNTTITAQWNIIQYTITFDTAGGSAIPPITQDYGTAITAPNNPTKDGYTFAGWNKEIPTTMPAESVTITAQWTADEHTITYNNTKGAINSNPVKFTTDTPTFDLSNLSVDGYTFDGWFDAETQGTKVEQISQGTITNLVLYAHWTPVTYAIAYQNVPNEYTAPSTYTVESTVIIPKPVRNGHTLKGWKEYVCNETNIVQCEGNDRHFVKDIFAEGDSTTINQWSTVGHREFRAQWNVNQYEVIFQNYDRSILKVQILDYGTPVTAPDDPSKPADAQKVYTFDGWQINGEGTVIATENLPTVSGDVHYVAHFDEDANHHTITFKNGDTVLQSTEVTYEQTPIYAGQTPTKANTAEISYTFAGWTDGTNEYAKDDTLPAVTGPATYTAIFTESPRQYTVIFVDYDGTELKAATAYDFGTPAANIVRPSDPMRVGYTFNGWDNIPETIPAHDVIVTATYTINQYTVTFDTDGGGSVDPVRVDYNTAISRPADPTKDGYTFSKWQKVDGQTLSDYDFATPVTDNITLKAIWTKNNYTIVYKDGDQTITIPGATTSYTITDEIVIPNPEKLGYTFIGWKEYVDGEYTKAYLNEGSSITIESGNIGNRVYVAQWNNTTNGYVVLWIDWNDVIIDMNTDVLYGTPVANISKPSDPTRVADAQYTYTFANWTKDEIDIADITSEIITGNVKYKAKYNETINKYKLIFVDEDGTTVLKGEKEYVYGTPVDDIEKPEVRIKTGWKFIGWNPALSMVTENVTYKAVYTINQYTIAFDTNGGSTIVPITQDYNTPINISNPTKEGYTFKGWIPSLPSNMPAENMVVVAQWEKSGGSGGSGGGSSSGGGGGKSSKKSSTGDIQENTDKNVEENTHNSAGDEGTGEIGGEDQGNTSIVIDSESLDAYEWARENSITTMNSIERADPDGYVTRGHLAKMLVNFVVNVLGRSIPYDVSYDCVMWNDNPLVWESDEIRDYAIKSCALGIMGINTLNNEFRPNDIVTRAEFGTVASRILWGDTYNELDTDNNLFYTKHLKALQESGFMMDIDNPLGRREIRKRVWLVLKRIELDQNKEKKES